MDGATSCSHIREKLEGNEAQTSAKLNIAIIDPLYNIHTGELQAIQKEIDKGRITVARNLSKALELLNPGQPEQHLLITDILLGIGHTENGELYDKKGKERKLLTGGEIAPEIEERWIETITGAKVTTTSSKERVEPRGGELYARLFRERFPQSGTIFYTNAIAHPQDKVKLDSRLKKSGNLVEIYHWDQVSPSKLAGKIEAMLEKVVGNKIQ